MNNSSIRTVRWFGAILLLGMAVSAASAEQKTAPLIPFDSSLPQKIKAVGMKAQFVKAGSSRELPGYLRLSDMSGKRRYVVFPIRDSADLLSSRSLSMPLRVKSRGRAVTLRWLAVNEDDQVLFQRVFTFDQGGIWTELDFPLALWRWGNSTVGRWRDIRRIALRVESEADEVHIGRLGLVAGMAPDSAWASPEWLEEVAFGRDETRSVSSDGLLVATSVTEHFSPDDVKARHADMLRIRKWLMRIGGDAASKAEKGQYAALLIFRDAEEYRGFWGRVGEAWRAHVVPPKSGGYTVQSIAASSYDWRFGADRPVYLHEAVHALATVHLGIRSGHAQHSWLQEGLANYLQLCVYPGSLNRDNYAKWFAQKIGTPDAHFLPLKQLLARRVSGRDYAQLASVMAFLLEQRPQWLPKIIQTLRRTDDPLKALAACGTTAEKMQVLWMEWGQKRFVGSTSSAGGDEEHFEMPSEFRDRSGKSRKKAG
ncbi:MAG: hypothetical protein ACLFVU_05325 [Phycisphaerae bacterium]